MYPPHRKRPPDSQVTQETGSGGGEGKSSRPVPETSKSHPDIYDEDRGGYVSQPVSGSGAILHDVGFQTRSHPRPPWTSVGSIKDSYHNCVLHWSLFRLTEQSWGRRLSTDKKSRPSCCPERPGYHSTPSTGFSTETPVCGNRHKRRLVQ